MNINLDIIHSSKIEYFIIIEIGKINTISTSKIKKITAIKKKCNENGIRDDLKGSNPHSKGEDFSRSMNLFLEIITIIIIIKNRIIIIIIININIFKINSSNFWSFWLEVKYTIY